MFYWEFVKSGFATEGFYCTEKTGESKPLRLEETEGVGSKEEGE